MVCTRRYEHVVVIDGQTVRIVLAGSYPSLLGIIKGSRQRTNGTIRSQHLEVDVLDLLRVINGKVCHESK